MNIYIIKSIKIRSYEMGLYFRDGEFKELLREGRHWFVDPLGKVKVEVVSQRTPWLVHEKLDMIVKSGALAGRADHARHGGRGDDAQGRQRRSAAVLRCPVGAGAVGAGGSLAAGRSGTRTTALH